MEEYITSEINDCYVLGYSWGELEKKAQNRDEWRLLVLALYALGPCYVRGHTGQGLAVSIQIVGRYTCAGSACPRSKNTQE